MFITQCIQAKHCRETGLDVRMTIETRLPMQSGLGALGPKRGGYTDVECERSQRCAEEGRDCIWAVGSMRSTRDPLGLGI
ncbi:MAG: hypothetical protein HRF49_09800 [bacterium]|jgi:hypothetical protein